MCRAYLTRAVGVLLIAGFALAAVTCGAKSATPTPDLEPLIGPTATTADPLSGVGAGTTTPTTRIIPSGIPPDAAGNALVVPWDPTGTGQYRLYLVAADGSQPQRLIADTPEIIGGEIEPAWSSDGTRIAFVGYVGDGVDLFVVNADGSGLLNLTNEAGIVREPAWSPDGEWIAFVSSTEESDDITLIRPDGSGRRLLTGSLARDAHPAWSPDGSTIAFLRIFPGSPVPIDESTPIPSADATQTAVAHIPSAIMLIDANGDNLRTLATLAWYGDPPRWSPDGASVATADGEPAERQVTLLDIATGSASIPFASQSSHVRTYVVRWVPHTERISVVAIDREGSQGQIVTANLDGSEAQTFNAHAGNHEWSPEGDLVAVLVERIASDGASTGRPNLYLVAGDGSSEQLVFAYAALGPGMAWRPATP